MSFLQKKYRDFCLRLLIFYVVEIVLIILRFLSKQGINRSNAVKSGHKSAAINI